MSKTLAGGSIYNRFLGQRGFRGIDFTSHPSMVSQDRLADGVNVWRDYKSGQGSAIETFPGYRKIASGFGVVYGIYRFRVGGDDYIIVHGGRKLFYFKESDIGTGLDDTIPHCADFMAEQKSQGFQYGDSFYIIDGEHYVCVTATVENGVVTMYAYHADSAAYVPTTYIDGVEHEQRNMLADDFVEKCTVNDEYTILLHEKCQEIHRVFCEDTELVIDTYTKTNDTQKVKGKTYYTSAHGGFAIEPNKRESFWNDEKNRVVYNSSIELDGLICIQLNDTAANLQNGGYEFLCARIKENTRYWSVYKDGTILERNVVESKLNDDYGIVSIVYGVSRGTRISFSVAGIEDLYEPPENYAQGNFSTNFESNLIKSITISEKVNNESISGKTIAIYGKASQSKFSKSDHTPFLSSESGYAGTALDAINNCTICQQFDGRVFFTGNPNLPNTVFYTQRDNTGHNNPLYIGTYNFFNTGEGSSPNVAMIASGSNLIVLKKDTIQDGSINLYQGENGTDDILPRIYVRHQGLSGIGCLGAACNFADDPVFITTRGLDAVGTQAVNLERTVQHRSSNVDRKLTSEDLANAMLTEWEGYLILLTTNGRAYLADSRQVYTNQSGYIEYEWYYLDDIGSYGSNGDNIEHDVYAFSYALPEDTQGLTDLSVKTDSIDCIAETEVLSAGDVHYTIIDDVKYYVYPTGERTGGAFYPASCIVGMDEYLIFGTTGGALCVFNTDKRGTMPTSAEQMEITTSEYAEKYGDIIPRQYYSHAGHKYLSYIALAQENAGVPHLVKNTVKRSVVLKAKDMFGSKFMWNVKTDRDAFEDSAEIVTAMPDFSSTEFASFLFDTSYDGAIIAIPERKKRYVEKQYAFFSDEYCRPFGIYNISYQYEIQGKVKNR